MRAGFLLLLVTVSACAAGGGADAADAAPEVYVPTYPRDEEVLVGRWVNERVGSNDRQRIVLEIRADHTSTTVDESFWASCGGDVPAASSIVDRAWRSDRAGRLTFDAPTPACRVVRREGCPVGDACRNSDAGTYAASVLRNVLTLRAGNGPRDSAEYTRE